MDVLMPQLGETVAEGTVAAWHKQVGDRVEADEILLDVETDKVSMEIPAPRAGTLVEIRVEAGQTVEVGAVLAVVRGDGEAAGTEAPMAAAPAPASEAAAVTATAGPIASTGPTTSTGSTASADPTTAAGPASASGTGTAALQRSDTQRLSPAVRRLVAEHDIDVEAVPGSGRNGRITRRNVLEYLEGKTADPAAAPPPQAVAPPPQAASAAPTAVAASPAVAPEVVREAPAAAQPAREAPAPAPAPDLGAGTIPFNRVRRLTADHMVKSKAMSPHVLQAVEVDFSGVDRVRKAMRESWRAQHGYSLTYLPFIAYAVCGALREFPHVNASVKDDALVLHPYVNLAIAVDLGADGLVAPVIKSAESMSVTQLAGAIQDVASRARTSRLRPDDLSGGTYTLSNSGTFGTLITAPIINQPQVAILSTDGVRKKPVVIERPDGDSIAIRPIGILAQSFDHRAFDGAYSAAFLDRLRKRLELTDWFREI